MTLLPGQIIGGHYEILGPLGGGGFGKTYLAEDLHAERRQRAIKLFCPRNKAPGAFAKALELFEREAAVLCDLTDPPRNSHIPRFFAYFDENQQFYLVQEFIQGQTLRDKLQQKNKLPENEVAKLLEEMLEILKFLHGEKIIHRDIKPDNVMIREQDSQVVLIDFGAVKQKVTQPGNFGTRIQSHGYTPPEQSQEGAAEYNSDIYALGITAIEALTGLELVSFKDRPIGKVLCSIQPKINDGLVKILEKMVHKDHRRGRYQSVDEVLRDVKEFRKTLLTSTSPPTWNQLFAPSLIRNTFSNIATINPLWMFAVLASVVMAIVLPLRFLTVKPLVDQSSPSEVEDSDNESPIRFKRANPQPTEGETQLIPTASEPTSDSPIRFKRANPTPDPVSLQSE